MNAHLHDVSPLVDRERLRELLDRVQSIAPVLAEHSAAGERAGRLADEPYAALAKAGLLRLLRPASLGGLEVDPVTYAVVAEEVSTHDTAAGWMMMVANISAFDLRFAQTPFVDAIYAADEDALVCATFNKPLRAHASGGGYVVSGTSSYVSGCDRAAWVGHLAMVDDGGDEPHLILAYHPVASVEVVQDWDALGMRATASHTVALRDVYVPGERVVEFAQLSHGAHHRGPLYRCPLAVLISLFPPVSLGATRTALEALARLAADKVPFATQTTLSHRPLAQLRYARALATYRATRAYLHDELGDVYRQAVAGEPFSLPRKADIVLACTHVLQQCADAVREIAAAAGATTARRTSPFERALRDTEVIRHHGFASENRYVSAGQAYFGVDLDFPLMALD